MSAQPEAARRSRFGRGLAEAAWRAVGRRIRVEELESRMLLANVVWDGGGDGVNWGDPLNWNTNLLPGAGDDVTVAAGPTAVQFWVESVHIRTLIAGRTIQVNGGSISATMGIQANVPLMLQGGTLRDTTITASGAGIALSGYGGTLDHVTIPAGTSIDATAPGGPRAVIRNGLVLNGVATLTADPGYGGLPTLTFTGTQSLTGTGSIVFGNGLSWYGDLPRVEVADDAEPATLTIAPTILIRGANGRLVSVHDDARMVIPGTIWADAAGAIRISGNVQTQGATLRVTNGGTLAISGTVTSTGNTLTLNGQVLLEGGTLAGGTLAGSGSSLVLTSYGGLLNGVTIASGLTLNATGVSGPRADIRNGLTLNGTAIIDADPFYGAVPTLNFVGTQTLGGTGSVRFGSRLSWYGDVGRLQASPDGATTGSLTIAPSMTVYGANGRIIALGNASIVHCGVIRADSPGTMTLDGALASQGTPTLAAVTGGTLDIAGVLGNHGISLTLEGTPTLRGGTIRGGTLAGSGASLRLSDSGGTLEGVTIPAGVQLDGATLAAGRVQVRGGLRLDGQALLNANPSYGALPTLEFIGSQPLSGAGSIVFGGLKSWYGDVARVLVSNDGAVPAALTVAPTITVRGTHGRIAGSVDASIVNHGRITADGADGTITLAVNMINVGAPAFGTANGGTLKIAAAISNNGATMVLSGRPMLAGGSIVGGTVAGTGSSLVLSSDGGLLNGTTIATGVLLDVTDPWGPRADVRNGLTLNGDARIECDPNSGSLPTLRFIGTQAVTGVGTIRVGNRRSWYGDVAQILLEDEGLTPATLTIGDGVAIRAAGASIRALNTSAMIVNQGTIAAESGAVVRLFGDVANTGVLDAGSGRLDIDGSLTVNNHGLIRSRGAGEIRVTGSLRGNTGNASAFAPAGLLFNGAGTAASPQLLEAMSGDFGATAAAMSGNFAVGSVVLANGTYVRLTDLSHNRGTAPEAVYVKQLVVPGGSTLDLGGLRLYAQLAQVTGTVIGVVTAIPDSGPIETNSTVPGAVSSIGQIDEWTFYARAGRQMSVAVDTGSAAVLAPQLGWARVDLLNSSGSVLATGANVNQNGTVTLANITIPADGTYRLQITAPADHGDATGNYRVSVYDITADTTTILLGQQYTGLIGSPFNVDRWTFAAAANTQVRFNLIGQSGGPVAFSLVGPGSFSGFSEITSSSDLVTLPSSGTYTLSAHASGDDYDGSYRFMLEQTSVTALALNTPYPGSFAASGQAQLYTVLLPDAGVLRVQLDDAAGNNTNEMYARFGAAPTRQEGGYDLRATGSSDLGLFAPMAYAGQWYILVYSQTTRAPSTYTLTASSTQLSITGVTPDRSASNVEAQLTIEGAGFIPGVGVELVSFAGTAYPATSVVVDSFQQITATFAANSIPADPLHKYSLRVSRTGVSPAVLTDAYTVLPAGQAKLETKLIMPEAFGRHAVATIYIEYANTGNAAMPAPLIVLHSTDPNGSDNPILTLDESRILQNYWSSAMPAGTSHEISILGSGAQPGVLNPGERMRVPVYYLGLQQPWDFSDTKVEMELRYWKADDTAAMDWGARKSSLRPTTWSTQTWDAVYANLTSGLNTTGAFVSMLAENARYLARLGERVNDVGALWAFELQQSGGLSPLATLDSATDAAIPSPGVSLTLRREFNNGLQYRQDPGIWGYGWYTPWSTYLAAATDGSLVTVVGSGGTVRQFVRDQRNGRYFSPAGDSSTLSAVGGAYELRDVGGVVTRFLTNGRINYITDANGNRVTAGYDGSGRLVSLTHTSGASLTLAYNAAGRIGTITDSAGRVTTYGYDAGGTHLLTVQEPDGKQTVYTYDTSTALAARHALTSVSRAGVTRTYTYDARGRLASTYVGASIDVVSFTYDAAGGVNVTDADSTSRLYYNQWGDLARVVDALGNSTTAHFNAAGLVTSLELPTGDTQQVTWNSRSLPAAYTNELGQTVRFDWDSSLGALSGYTDARGNRTRYDYDARGNLVSETMADGSMRRFIDQNPAGLAGQMINARGQATSYTYTALGQVATETLPDGTVIGFLYDARGNLTQASRTPPGGSASITSYIYNYAATGDRLVRVNYPNGRYVEYGYDSATGRQNRITDSTGAVTQYQYDAGGRVWRVLNGSGAILAEYLYNAAGLLDRMNAGNGTWTIYGYDMAGQQTSVVNYAAGGAITSRYDYTYDALGRRRTLHTLDGDWTYGYDAAGRLTSAVFVSTNPLIANQNCSYSYDAAGNRTSVTVNGVTTAYQANALNQYTSVGETAYRYDADGNLTFDGENAYQYDSANRMIRMSGPGGTLQYEYDTLGNRNATIRDGVRTEYLVDPTGTVNVMAEYSGGGTVQAQNVFGLGLVGRSAGGSALNYYQFDGLGSTVSITDASGAIANRYAYGAFGDPLLSSGAFSNPFGFSGHFGVLGDSGRIIAMDYRSYSTALGQFMQRDPSGLSGGYVNLYSYLGNSPMNGTDVMGRASDEGLFAWIRGYRRRMDATNNFIEFENSRALEEFHAGNAEIVRNTDAAVSDLSRKIDYTAPPRKPGDVWKFGKFMYGLLDASGLLHRRGRSPFGSIPSGAGDGTEGGSAEGQEAAASDPNDKTGVAGVGAAGFISLSATLPYLIRFENTGPGSVDPVTGNPYPPSVWATAPAQRVVVTDQLSAHLDWEATRITEIGFGDMVLPVNAQHYEYTTSMEVNGTTIDVAILADVDSGTGMLRVELQSLDAATGLPPEVLLGLLPPEDGSGRGKGYISIVSSPKAGLPTGTQIRNVALIQFDANEIIGTNQVDPHNALAGTDPAKECLNTIDAAGPASIVAPLPAQQASAAFTVVWSGSDDAGGSGVAAYDIHVRDGASGSWQLWLGATTLTSSVYAGRYGHTYSFCAIATDAVGNREAQSPSAEATTSTPANQAPTNIALSSTAVQENRPAGTVIGSLSSTDANPGDTFTYTLVGGTGSTDNASFTLAGNQLHTVASFDYETKSSYAVRLRTTDAEGLWFEKAFTISVADVDEVAPTVSSWKINGGGAQRSMVRNLTVVFSEAVTLAGGAVTVLLSTGTAVPNTTINVSNPSADQKTYVLSFAGPAAIGGSLADGIYDLRVTAPAVHDLAGNVMTGSFTQRFHRLFGDGNGDRRVNLVDYRTLRTTLGRSSGQPLFNDAMDYDNSGTVNTTDLTQFRRRFGRRYSY